MSKKYSEVPWICGILGVTFLMIPLMLPRVPGLAILLFLRVVGIDFYSQADAVVSMARWILLVSSIIISSIGLISGILIVELKIKMILPQRNRTIVGIVCCCLTLLLNCLFTILRWYYG